MATPCEAAQATWNQLPHGNAYGSDAALYPRDWPDFGVATMSTMLALARGFAGWYARPTDGCPVSSMNSLFVPYQGINPYEDESWRLAAVLALWQYIEGAAGPEGIQAQADYFFGRDRAILRAAIVNEDDSPTLLGWLRIALTIGLTGVREQILMIAERGGIENVVAGADLVLANWLPVDVDDATLARAQRAAIAAMTPGPGAENLQKAGTALLARVQFIQASRTAPGSIAPPAPIPPTAIVPFTSTSWWSNAWPIVLGGSGGVLIFVLAWLRRQRRRAPSV